MIQRTPNPMRTHWKSLACSLLLCFATAAIGALASRNAADFYQQLARPSWAPPGWLFAPVWSSLYLMMAIAAWLVWRARSDDTGGTVTRPALLFLLQLLANGLWTWLFFEWKLGALAFAEVILLWLLVLITTRLFWRRRPLAGLLMLPYLLWVGFATALTFAVWQANPGLLG